MTRAIHRIVGGRSRRLAAGLVAIVAAVSTVVIPPTAANAATLNMTVFAHVCRDIGHTSAGIHGIFCTDLAYVFITGGTRYYEVTEAYCQNETSGGYVECLDNQVRSGLYGEGLNNNYLATDSCSASVNPCGVGRHYFFNRNVDLPKGKCMEMWGVTWGDTTGGPQSSIDLPGAGGGRVKLEGNLGTDHYVDCG
ncbi:MAG: hypothetical protein J2P17_25165 [Mycobacterium sp.]|nr:hypothetical protein [Mycobacterium sp.]